MTSFSSPVEDIRRLHFAPLPARPIKVARAARSGGVTVFLGENGRIYSTGLRERAHYVLGCKDRSIEETFNACVKLGLVSKAMIQQHKAAADAVRARMDRRYAAQHIERDAKTLGLRLTPTQKRQIAEAKEAA